MYCDAKEIRFRNREELTLKSKAKTFIIDILLDIVGGCFIAIGVYNFAVASGFPVSSMFRSWEFLQGLPAERSEEKHTGTAEIPIGLPLRRPKPECGAIGWKHRR